MRVNNKYLFARGKRKDNNKWIYGLYTFQRKFDFEGVHDKYLIIDLRGKLHEVIPETIGRYTGRTDKNNRLIFEGDMVKITDINHGIKWITYVVFKNPYYDTYNWDWDLMYIREEPRINLKNIPLWIKIRESNAYYEVIGNIHDDDLLKEEEEMNTEWILKAVETIKSGVADKLMKDNITIYRVKNIIRIDIKE